MSKFLVYSGDVLVGVSELERGDPPMGVAFGALIPNAAYNRIRAECVANHADQKALNLSVTTAAGVLIPCVGVAVLDADLEGEPPEVNVLGVPYPLYGELFAAHVAAYEAQFRTAE
jgi:hypothetical protein